jgi:hypothetical protein
MMMLMTRARKAALPTEMPAICPVFRVEEFAGKEGFGFGDGEGVGDVDDWIEVAVVEGDSVTSVDSVDVNAGAVVGAELVCGGVLDVCDCVVDEDSEVVGVGDDGRSDVVGGALLFVLSLELELDVVLSALLVLEVGAGVDVDVSLSPSSGRLRKAPSGPSILVSGFLAALHSCLKVSRKAMPCQSCPTHVQTL